ncbi:hypothetical protein Ancab_014207 [Ancistrocladus abbreviatus]
MGKSLLASSPTKLHHHLKRLASDQLVAKSSQPSADKRVKTAKLVGGVKLERKGMQNNGGSSGGEADKQGADIDRQPLSAVVADCVRRWFQDTLKEAKAGDTNMQVLVSQMYYSGYGVPKDAQKGRLWMTRASRLRSSAWKVSEKRPGYNASDSDSEELQGES